jgi:flagellar basal-body rod modification protein FlgD
MPEAGEGEVAIYDLEGRVVRQFHSGAFVAGVQEITWDGRDDVGRMAVSGLYLARVQGRGLSLSTKILRIP